MKIILKYCSRLHAFSIYSLALVVTISGTALAGWLIDVPIFSSIHKSFIPMAPSTALFFMILCGALVMHLRLPDHRSARIVARVAALFVTVVSMVMIADYFIDAIDLDIEGLIPVTTGKLAAIPTGRMSPISAASFSLAGLALLSLSQSSREARFFREVSALLATIVTTIGLVVLIGYLHGSPLLYGGAIIPVALPTAIAFIALGIGLCASTGPDIFPQRLFLGDSIRSRLMRAFLPVTVAIVLIQGILGARFHSRITNPSLISSLMTLLSLTAIGFLITAISRIISNRIETAEMEQKRLQEELRESNKLLNVLSNTDSLTQLYNRRYLMDSLEKEMKRQKRTNSYLTLLLFDVDHFKIVNDVFGHQKGDAVLMAIATVAQGLLRCNDIAARYGGEEFVMLLPETTLSGGVVVAERLRESVQAISFAPPMGNLSVTISVGVATFPSSSIDDVDTLLREADEALYRAKNGGRNRIEIMMSRLQPG